MGSKPVPLSEQMKTWSKKPRRRYPQAEFHLGKRGSRGAKAGSSNAGEKPWRPGQKKPRHPWAFPKGGE